MSTARDFLAAVQQRADAATDGPWHATRWGDSDGRQWGQTVLTTDREITNSAGCLAVDAAFIAASRTDVPRLVAALTAALDLADEREEELGDLILPDLRALVRDIRAVITDALTPKENDS